MTPIRVLQLVRGVAIGGESGGAELHAIRVAELLPRPSFEAAVFAMWAYDSPAERSWRQRLASQKLPIAGLTPKSDNSMRRLFDVFRRLWSETSRFKPHIVHSHSEQGDFLNAWLHLLHPSHPLAVRTVHLDSHWRRRPIIGSWIEKGFFPLVYRAEIAVSQAICTRLGEAGHRDPSRIWLCYNGIDESAFELPSVNERQRPSGVPDVRPLLGIVGRLAEQKGHRDLIDALKMINDKAAAHLLVIGDGPLRRELTAYVERLGLAGRVHFLGVRNDVLSILQLLDAFVLPSLWEGFPTVVLEAMSQETPVIASDIPGTRELVISGQTGLLVPPHDPAALADAIFDTLARPQSARLRAQQAKGFARPFTIQNTCACYTRIYEAMLAEERRSSTDDQSPGETNHSRRPTD